MRSCHADHLQMRRRANEMSPASACAGSPVCARLNRPLSEAEVAGFYRISRSCIRWLFMATISFEFLKKESWYLKQAEG